MQNGSRIQNTKIPAQKITSHIKRNHSKHGSVIWWSHTQKRLECVDMKLDPLFVLQTVFVCKRATKLHLPYLTAKGILYVFFYLQSKINFCSPESDDYRQLFLSFLFLVFLGVWNFSTNTLLKLKLFIAWCEIYWFEKHQAQINNS